MIKPKPNVKRSESGFTDEEIADWLFIAQKARKMKKCRLFRTKLVIDGKTIAGAVIVELRQVEGRGFIRPLAVMVRPEMAGLLPDFPLSKPTPEPGPESCACAAGPDEKPDEGPDEEGEPLEGEVADMDDEPDDDESDDIPGAAEVEAVQAATPPQAEKPDLGPALVEKTPEPESKHGEEPHD